MVKLHFAVQTHAGVHCMVYRRYFCPCVMAYSIVRRKTRDGIVVNDEPVPDNVLLLGTGKML